MSKMSANKRKLSLNRETLRTLSSERLEEVAGGDRSIGSASLGCTASYVGCPSAVSCIAASCYIACGPLL